MDKLNFTIVDTKRPEVPQYEENSNAKGFVNWGKDNTFPSEVYKMYLNSVTVRSIIDGTVNYICGNGINVDESAAKWKGKINRKGEELPDLISQVATDLMIYDGFAIQVIYNKMGTVVEMYALDFGRCRVNSNGDKVYYSSKWGTYTTKYKEYDAFDRSKINPENPTQIYFYKGAARTCYPYPTWGGAFKDALTEIETGKLQLNSVANGLNAKSLITLPNDTGTLTNEEKEAVEEAIREKFYGSEATSSFFLFWREEGMSEMKVDSIKTEDDSNKFKTMKESARDNIFVAFRATPTLFGILQQAKGFSKTEYKEAYELYYKIQVKPRQKKICSVLNKIIGADNAVTILPFDIDTDE